MLPNGSFAFERTTSRNSYINAVDVHRVFFIMMQDPTAKRQDLSKMQEQERYAVDLTHAQYGHHDETLMPWKTYVETRVSVTGELLPLGRARAETEKMMLKLFGDEGRRLQTITGLFEKALTSAVRDISCWTSLWKEPNDATYKQQVDKILQHVTT
ncbi:MAG: hypothetical protein Q9174_006250, partial [Haloplaca sp. 1 TL-2023]